MNEHRYILEPYKGMKTRYSCPSCQQQKVFALYIDTETGEHLNETVGRCNRESSCAYHYAPKQYFEENNISFDKPQQNRHQRVVEQLPPKPISFITVEVFTASLQSHESNNFIKYLIELFGFDVTKTLIEKYFIGTSKYWNGATVFWQIDNEYNIRTGKILLYSPTTGKRVKEPFNHICWVHTALKLSDFELKQCFFGEHLLQGNNKPLAIVESEKTAVVASVYLPEYIWLATGGLNNLKVENCKVLQGRTVFLYPDLNGFEKWSNKAKDLSHLTKFEVSDLLKRNASDEERKLGLDLADYLIRFDYKDFIEPEPPALPPPPAVEVLLAKPITVIESIGLNESGIDCSNQISEIENFFKSIVLPKYPIKLNHYTTIEDVALFVESNLEGINRSKGKRVFLSCLERLQELKQKLTII